MTAERELIKPVQLEASDDGLRWTRAPLAGKYHHCPLCEVGVLLPSSPHCPNCLAAVRVRLPEAHN